MRPSKSVDREECSPLARLGTSEKQLQAAPTYHSTDSETGTPMETACPGWEKGRDSLWRMGQSLTDMPEIPRADPGKACTWAGSCEQSLAGTCDQGESWLQGVRLEEKRPQICSVQ